MGMGQPIAVKYEYERWKEMCPGRQAGWGREEEAATCSLYQREANSFFAPMDNFEGEEPKP